MTSYGILAVILLLQLDLLKAVCFDHAMAVSTDKTRNGGGRKHTCCGMLSFLRRQAKQSLVRDQHEDHVGLEHSSGQSIEEHGSGLRTRQRRSREGLREVCASSNSCEAFAVSSDQHVSENKWQCTVYYACPSKQYNEHLDLYERQEPKACLAKATTYDGVFVNFLEVNGLVSQTTRTLRVVVKPFETCICVLMASLTTRRTWYTGLTTLRQNRTVKRWIAIAYIARWWILICHTCLSCNCPLQFLRPLGVPHETGFSKPND